MVAAATSADPDLQRVLQHVLHCWPSSKPEVASELRTYFNVQAELSVAGVDCCLRRGSRDFAALTTSGTCSRRTSRHQLHEVQVPCCDLVARVRTPLTILPLSLAEQPETSSPVKARVQFQQLRMSEQHDRRHRAKFPTIQAGDMVRIRLPRRKHKLTPVYSEPLTKRPAIQSGLQTASNGTFDGVCITDRRCRIVRRHHFRFHRKSVHRASIHLLTLIRT